MSKKILIKDTTIKILSVVFAIILWFYVITEQDSVTTKNIVEIPVELINMDYLDRNDLVLMNNVDGFKLNISTNAKKSVLDSITNTSVKVTADLSGIKNEGTNQIPINIAGIPDGVSWKPSLSSIDVIVEPKVSSNLEIKINVSGNPAQGLATMKPIVNPGDVIVSGPLSIVEKIKYADVDIDVSGENSDVSKNLSVRLSDFMGNEVSNVDFQPKRVNVKVPISNTKLVPIVFDMEGLPSEGFIVTNTYYYPKEFLITGKPDVLKNIESIKTEKLDVTGMMDSIDREIGLIIPRETESVNGAKAIRINVEIEEIITKNVVIKDIELRNLNPIYKHSPIDDNVYLTIRGSKSLVNKANSIIKLYLDMRYGKEGDNTFDIMWEKDIDLDIVSVNPSNISVNITKVEETNEEQVE